jgi:hypothetical protein
MAATGTEGLDGRLARPVRLDPGCIRTRAFAEITDDGMVRHPLFKREPIAQWG